MNTVRTVHIDVTRWSEHHGVSLCSSMMAMRRRIGVMVGLDFDDRSSDVIDQQGRSDQVRCNLMHAAGKKALESIAR